MFSIKLHPFFTLLLLRHGWQQFSSIVISLYVSLVFQVFCVSFNCCHSNQSKLLFCQLQTLQRVGNRIRVYLLVAIFFLSDSRQKYLNLVKWITGIIYGPVYNHSLVCTFYGLLQQRSSSSSIVDSNLFLIQFSRVSTTCLFVSSKFTSEECCLIMSFLHHPNPFQSTQTTISAILICHVIG